MKTWFTSDTHFGHENIIKYTHRPFRNREHMDSVLTHNWNERVKDGDTVIFLGDFCFHNTSGGKRGEGTGKTAADYIAQLKGYKVFVRGNHDNNNSLNTKITALEIEIGGERICCIHDPADFGDYKLNLCGHIHDKWKVKEIKTGVYAVNVGVDVWGFRPISIQEIQKCLNGYRLEESK